MLFEYRSDRHNMLPVEPRFSDAHNESCENLEPFKPRKLRLGEKEARIANLLRDFSSPKPEEAVESLTGEREMESLLPCPSEDVSFSQCEMEEARLAAFVAGHAQGKKEIQAELEAQFDEERISWEERLTQEIEAVKQSTIEDIACHVDITLQAGIENIKQSIEHDLAHVMADIFGSYLTKQALDDFVAKITHETIAACEPLVIEGKQAFLDVFAAKTQLAQDSYRLQLTASEEIRVVLADEVISTRLAPLIQELKALF